MRVIFMGTPEFAVPSLRLLAESGYMPAAVATGPDRPRGRGRLPAPSPVKMEAERLGIEHLLQPESVKDETFTEAVCALEPDVIVVVAYRILPPAVYQCARLGAFNLHGSILPAYRGAAPIHHAVLNGEKTTGVTTFFLEEDVDTGNVILTRSMPIGEDETTGDVYARMMEVGAEAVVETVRLIESGSVQTTKQDDAAATKAPKVHREDAEVDWEMPFERVHNFIRGMSPKPCAWTRHGGRTLKLYRSRLADRQGPPGEVLLCDDRLVIGCGTGSVELVEVQQPNRKRQSAAEFLRGYPIRKGDILGNAETTPRSGRRFFTS